VTTWLLDGNTLVALCLDGHEHHESVVAWLEGRDEPFATCSVTEGTLLRMHMRFADDPSAVAAWQTLAALQRHPRHVRWQADLSYMDVPHRYLQGPKQVTDAWLAELARRSGGCLATLDVALATLHGDVARVITTLRRLPAAE
jgi:hypothetical protein